MVSLFTKHCKHHLSAEVCTSTTAASQLKAGDALEIHHFQHVLGLRINLNNILLQSGNVRNVVISALTLFFLKLDGNSSDCGTLEPFHQMSDETGNFVSERFGRNYCNFFNDPLVGVKIEGQFSVVSVDRKQIAQIRWAGFKVELAAVAHSLIAF